MVAAGDADGESEPAVAVAATTANTTSAV